MLVEKNRTFFSSPVGTSKAHLQLLFTPDWFGIVVQEERQLSFVAFFPVFRRFVFRTGYEVSSSFFSYWSLCLKWMLINLGWFILSKKLRKPPEVNLLMHHEIQMFPFELKRSNSVVLWHTPFAGFLLTFHVINGSVLEKKKDVFQFMNIFSKLFPSENCNKQAGLSILLPDNVLSMRLPQYSAEVPPGNKCHLSWSLAKSAGKTNKPKTKTNSLHFLDDARDGSSYLNLSCISETAMLSPSGIDIVFIYSMLADPWEVLVCLRFCLFPSSLEDKKEI